MNREGALRLIIDHRSIDEWEVAAQDWPLLVEVRANPRAWLSVYRSPGGWYLVCAELRYERVAVISEGEDLRVVAVRAAMALRCRNDGDIRATEKLISRLEGWLVSKNTTPGN